MIPPEILLHIALFLDRLDLLSCVRVCQQWLETLSPCIYLSLDLNPPKEGAPKRDHYPPASAIQRYGCNVHDLTLGLPCCLIDELVVSVRRLKTVHIQSIYTLASDTTDELNKVIQLLIHNTDIQQLYFDIAPGQDMDNWLNHCLVQHETLEINSLELSNMAKCVSNQNLSFPSLKKLYLDVCCEPGLRVIIDWLSVCPQLEEFHLSRLRSEPLEHHLDFDILSELKGLCPRLQTLALCGVYLERTQLSKVIQSFPALTDIHITGSHTGTLFFRTLENRFPYLTSLELYDCTGIRDWMSLQILFSCPRLVRLVSTIASTVYLPPPAPSSEQGAVVEESYSHRFWACSGLRHLEVDEFLWYYEPEWNARAMEQLRALRDLEVLIVRRPWWQSSKLTFKEGLHVNLATGTGSGGRWVPWHQSQLTREQLEQHDALKWMVEAWPKFQLFGAGGQQLSR